MLTQFVAQSHLAMWQIRWPEHRHFHLPLGLTRGERLAEIRDEGGQPTPELETDLV